MMPETGIHLFFGAAHPQKDVPWVCLQEGCWSPRWQTRQWRRQQQLQGFFQGDPQKGQQGSCCQLPGLKCPFGISAFTTPQQMGDIPPPQISQEGFQQEAEKGRRHEPSPEKCRAQGLQGRGLPLNRHPTDIHRSTTLSNKNLVTQLTCLITR